MAGKGGPRPNAGRKKGQKNKATIERELIAAQQAEKRVQEAVNSGRKLGKDVLDEFMHLFAGMAATYQPLPPGATEVPPGRKPDEPRFEKYARLAVQCARDVASYQSPTFRAIMVAPPPPTNPNMPGMRKRFTLTIFEHGAAPKLIDARTDREEEDDAA